jgi:hypothetical protein
VKEGLGYAGPEKGRPRPLGLEKEEAGINLVVIDDAGNGFRDAEDVWPLAIKTPGWKPLIILKMSRPLQTGALWDRLVRDHGDNLVVVINADDLRSMEGVNISRQLSWERTAMELVWQLHKNHSLRSLKGCRNLIVRFGLDGAFHYSGGPAGAQAQLYYDPLLMEGGFQDNMVTGRMTGISIAFVAALTAQIATKGLEGLGEGVRQGILSSRCLLKLGFGNDPGKLDYPGAPIFRALPEEKEKKGKGHRPVSAIQVVPIPSPGPPECMEPSYWTILGKTAQERLEEVAGNYVRHGKDPVLRPVPVGRFGKLKTMDRAEIESLQSIKNLLHEYLQKSNPERPLSVAVFGQPGSGKSFTVTQVAESVAGKVIQRREFNLSQ